MITVLLGLLVLSVLVIIHETGHLLIARALGVRVERFSIGFGPVLLSRHWGDVEVAISAFPLGGYVKMGGDDPRNRESLVAGDFFAAAWWRRVLIALAGPGANFVLAVVLSTSLLWIGYHEPDWPARITAVTPGSLADSLGFAAGGTVSAVAGTPVVSLRDISLAVDAIPDAKETQAPLPFLVRTASGEEMTLNVPGRRIEDLFGGLDFVEAVVGEVVIGTPAYTAGLAVQDRIVAIDGEPVSGWRDLQRRISGNPDRPIVIVVERQGRRLEVPVTPAADKSRGKAVGRIGVSPASPLTVLIRRGLVDGAKEGGTSAVLLVGYMFKGIGTLFSSMSNLKQVAGPVAIIQASGSAARSGIDRLLDRAILFSIALMVFNLLPVPILDGGMVLLSLIEAARRRPLGARSLAVYQGIGMAVLGTLLIFVLINDPLRILQRRSAMGRIEDVAPAP